ncbi:hypothetical protein HD554DRAFT_2036675 [Boletus coccyginus]|nr:hypothetical protein HD554DRAFT_2036675 [Boletus coccyginus]
MGNETGTGVWVDKYRYLDRQEGRAVDRSISIASGWRRSRNPMKRVWEDNGATRRRSLALGICPHDEGWALEAEIHACATAFVCEANVVVGGDYLVQAERLMSGVSGSSMRENENEKGSWCRIKIGYWCGSRYERGVVESEACPASAYELKRGDV